MTLTKSNPRARQRWALLGGVVAVLMLVVAGIVLASTPAGLFELDGNAVSATGPGGAAPDDWDRVCHQVLGTDCSTTSNTHGATAVAWVDDAAIVTPGCAGGTNCTIFTGGGSKDPIDLNQWAWKTDTGGLPDKDNLLHGFAARYSLPSSATCPGPGGDTSGTTTCEMLFFGNDRYDNSGDAQQGFWFFQNKIGLGTNSVGGGQGFTTSNGTEFHRNGDLLIISDFSNGGTTSTITAYKWDTTCTKVEKNPAPGKCGDANLRILSIAANANCIVANPAITGTCGIVNPDNGTVAPWSYADKSGNVTYLQGEFFEGGVNLSSLGLGGECFASVASESRSSTETTAVLKDFVLGGFGSCTTGLVTTPKSGSGATLPDADEDGLGEVSIGTGSVTVKDSAVLTVAGVSTWSGTLQFYICGPLASGTCTTGGVPTESPALTVTNTTSQPIVSSAATLTSAGRYCWRGEFTHITNGVPDAKDDSSGECFEVLPVTPTLTTLASADTTVGNTITDTATISGTATQPGTNGGVGGTYLSINATNGAAAGGSISWRALGPNDCTTVAMASTSRTISGNGTYPTAAQTAVGFQANAPGTYTFVASYSGNSPNTNSLAESACPNAPSEDVIVTGNASLSTAQDWLPNDTATLTGPTNLNGTLTFQLYTGDNCGATSGAVVAGQNYPVTVTNAVSGSTFSTSNTTFKVLASASYSWLVTYDDTTLNDPAAKCEKTTLTITN